MGCPERGTTIYISDKLDFSLLKRNEFNLITAGCGTGKSYMVIHQLLRHFPDVEPYEVIFLTSRSVTVQQQSKNSTISRFSLKNDNVIAYWNGEENDLDELKCTGISIMTYDKLIEILIYRNSVDEDTLTNAKIIIFDECHSLFSDLFIRGIEVIRTWIRDTLPACGKFIIGMTATSGIVKFYENDGSGLKLNEINREPLVAHKAKQLICTDVASLPYLVTKCLSGRTIILCATKAQCVKLQSKIENSAVLVSQSAKEFNDDMQKIRDEIISHETLPNEFIDKDGNCKPLDILLCTSTLREGINLCEQSGIRNVVSCLSDELHVIQFAGRCRYSIDNLVVADTYIRPDNKRRDYLFHSRQEFRKFRDDKTNACWFDSISCIIDHDRSRVKWLYYPGDRDGFIKYINTKWLVPSGISTDERNAYKIFRSKDKQEIIDKAVSYGVIHLPKSKLTFNGILRLLQNDYGYIIEGGQSVLEKKRQSYKLIVSYRRNEQKCVPMENGLGL